ncbi:hypothetical protein [Kitasatospora sp. KL5]|uniref:hypothetical protein n=1 Tax=Kitasatospora sp. KL5 TaxID=3425125 RepID=UPI003D6DCB34
MADGGAGGTADGAGQDGGRAGGAGGEWWKSGMPWRVIGPPRPAADDTPADEQSVYAPKSPAAPGPETPEAPQAAKPPVAQDAPLFGSSGPGLTLPGWEVVQFDPLGEAARAAADPAADVPAQRAGAEAEAPAPTEPAPAAPTGRTSGKGKPGKGRAGKGGSTAGGSTGDARPSPPRRACWQAAGPPRCCCSRPQHCWPAP